MSEEKKPHISAADLAAVVGELSRHQGRAAGISAQQLAHKLGLTTRKVRFAVSMMREDGHLVCGHPGHGYFIGTTDEEVDETCAFLRDRAMHSLTLEARMRKVGLPELLGQLRLKT